MSSPADGHRCGREVSLLLMEHDRKCSLAQLTELSTARVLTGADPHARLGSSSEILSSSFHTSSVTVGARPRGFDVSPRSTSHEALGKSPHLCRD